MVREDTAMAARTLSGSWVGMEARCSDDGERYCVLARKMEASMVHDVSADFFGDLV
ncbi:hypothetical protein DEO72_LG3g2188 [Vigna unguiculata]|uniref:Uncharacterized protein n=1 Tax=Vigna unguiculata TaxID=3917 RepID=A0A4D6LG67_VIGUN|nr:hypothetical protein DEO72_LG3g2188 [Vigna unguiculata]